MNSSTHSFESMPLYWLTVEVYTNCMLGHRDKLDMSEKQQEECFRGLNNHISSDGAVMWDYSEGKYKVVHSIPEEQADEIRSNSDAMMTLNLIDRDGDLYVVEYTTSIESACAIHDLIDKITTAS